MADEAVNTIELQGWIERIQAGDTSARDELLTKMVGRLERLTRKMLKKFPLVKPWAETDDVLQSSLLRLVRALENVEITSMREFFALAALQMRRELIDLVRHYHGPLGEGRHRAGQLIENEPGLEPIAPDESEEELERWRRFHEQVEDLPVEEREVVGLVFYHGWTQTKVAELFHISERTVRRRWESAMVKLRTVLHEGSE